MLYAYTIYTYYITTTHIFMVASAFLPVAIHNGELKFLFGKELKTDSMPGFSDFGGSVKPTEDIFNAGLREFAEETTGFLGDEKQLKQMITKNGGHLNFLFEKTKYHIHVIKIDYDEHLVKYFNASQKFIHDKILNSAELKKYCIFEKIELKWFTQKEIENSIDEFREFYRDIIKDVIIKNMKEIQTFIETCNDSSKQKQKHNKTGHNKKIKNKTVRFSKKINSV